VEGHLSQEESNIFLELRYLPWDGKEIRRGDRFVVHWNDGGKSKIFFSSTPHWVDEAMARAYGVIKKHFEIGGKILKGVTFIQERKPRELHHDDYELPTIANSNAGVWHTHHKENRDKALLIFDELGGTEFIEGKLFLKDETDITHEEIETALNSGSAEMKTLEAGRIGYFTNKTVHKRGEFKSVEPRLVVLLEFED